MQSTVHYTAENHELGLGYIQHQWQSLLTPRSMSDQQNDQAHPIG